MGCFLWFNQVRKTAATMAPFCLSKLDHEHEWAARRRKSGVHPSAPEREEVPPEEAKVLDDDDEDCDDLNTMCQCRNAVQPLTTIEQKERHRKVGRARYHG